MRALGYVRQSRESQAAASPEAQRRAIEQYAESQGWRLIETFSDIGRSGFDPKAQRPGLEELLTTAERGGVDRVIVWKLDRLTRRGISEALVMVERIEAVGAALVSVTEPFDTSSALGQGIFALLLSLAQAESEKLAERVRSGKAIVRERGGWLGGPVPYGFRIQRVERTGYSASRLVLNERAPIVRSMVDDVLDGKSVLSIVRRLNADGVAPPRGREWGHASVTAILRSPVLAGHLTDGHGGVLRDADGVAVECGEALLTADEWRALSTRMTPQKGRRPQVLSLLGGIARCAGCNGTMGGDRSQNQYRCNRAASGYTCEAPARVPMAATDAHVLGTLAEMLRNAVELRALGALDSDEDDPYERLLRRFSRWWALREGATDVEALAIERADIGAARARLREMYAAGDFADDPSAYRRLFDSYERRWRHVTEQLATLQELPTPAILNEPNFFDALDFDTLRAMLAEVTTIRCVKADRPGVRFEPFERIIWQDDEDEPLAS